MSEEAPVLLTPLRVTRKEEPVSLQIFPEELGRKRMVLGAVLGAPIDTVKGPADGIARFLVAELHDKPRGAGGYLDTVEGRVELDGAIVVAPC